MDPVYARNKLILITAFVTMAVTSAVWIGLGTVGYFAMYREPPSFQLEVNHPGIVEEGDVFRLTVEVTNVGAKDLKLANVDFYEDLLEGFELVSAHPAPRSVEKIIGYASYNFGHNLPPGETFMIELSLKAKDVGLWGGDIDACTPTQNLVTHYTEIEVVAPPVP